MERNFKGVWIPKEIWLAEDLTIQEKVLLVEIDSLDDGERGCYASNNYFAKFFGITPGRISQMVTTLTNKNYISVSYIKENNEIKERQIHINRPPYPEVVNKLNTYLENYKRGIKNTKGGYLENYEENNITNNNITNNNITNNNIKYFDDDELDVLFKDFLKMRKKLKAVNSERAINGLLNKLKTFTDDVKKEMVNESIINSWKSIYPLKEDKKTARERREEELKKVEEAYLRGDF